jgi:predicted DNA-binding transcriptional regulator AlpA
MTDESPLVDRAGAAAILTISVAKFDRMVKAGLAPCGVSVGTRSVRWLRAELLAWLHAGCPDQSSWELMKSPAASP